MSKEKIEVSLRASAIAKYLLQLTDSSPWAAQVIMTQIASHITELFEAIKRWENVDRQK